MNSQAKPLGSNTREIILCGLLLACLIACCPADASVPVKQSSPPKKGSKQPNHVWAGSFLACWGSNDLDVSPPAAAAVAGKAGIEVNDSARQQMVA